VLIAHHDSTIGGRHISKITYDEIRQMDGDVPVYEDVLKLTGGRMKLDIELKEEGYESEAVDLALTYMAPDNFVVTSFENGCLKALKQSHPQIKLGLILGRHQLLKAFLSRICSGLPAKWAGDAQADYLIIDYKLASAGILKASQQRGLKVMVWTVNERQAIQRFLSNDLVCGIITNYPDIAVKLKGV
jgi:glycerophosphoryl diester phosphodiesterase